MFKLNLKLMAGALVCSAMLAGCFGGGDDDTVAQPAPTPTPTPAPQTVSAVVDYIKNLIASSTNETGEPIDINSLTLATDDTTEPATLQ